MRKVLYILGELSDGDMEWLIKVGKREKRASGTILIEKHEPVHGIYIVIEGKLGVVSNREGGKIIATLGPGELVGEMSFIEGRNPSVYVKVLDPALLLLISRAELISKLRDDLGFASRFYKAITLFLSQRVRSTTAQLGYSDTRELSLPGDKDDDPDELSTGVLDNVYLAGTRFENLMRRLKTE